jgi:hypothetical protein
MTKRLACPPAPGPLEDYATQFDPLFVRLAQRLASAPTSKACCCRETATRR